MTLMLIVLLFALVSSARALTCPNLINAYSDQSCCKNCFGNYNLTGMNYVSVNLSVVNITGLTVSISYFAIEPDGAGGIKMSDAEQHSTTTLTNSDDPSNIVVPVNCSDANMESFCESTRMLCRNDTWSSNVLELDKLPTVMTTFYQGENATYSFFTILRGELNDTIQNPLTYQQNETDGMLDTATDHFGCFSDANGVCLGGSERRRRRRRLLLRGGGDS